MQRREFLKTTGAAAIAAPATVLAASDTAATHAQAAEPARAALDTPSIHAGLRTLRLHSPLLDARGSAGDQARRLAHRLATAADGRWHLERAAPDTAADRPRASSLVAVASGHADLSLDLASEVPVRRPDDAYFAGLPGGIGMDAAALDGWLRAGGGQELWDELMGEIGAKPLLAGCTGAAPTLWSRTPIETTADLGGRAVALSAAGAMVADALGMVVRTTETEPVDALATGAIDIAETPDASVATRHRFAGAAPYGYASPFAHHGQTIALHVRRALWDTMTAGDRALLEGIAAEALAVAHADHAADRVMAAMVWAASPGLLPSLRPLAADVGPAVRTLAATVVAEAAANAAITRRIDASYMAFRRATLTDVFPVA